MNDLLFDVFVLLRKKIRNSQLPRVDICVMDMNGREHDYVLARSWRHNNPDHIEGQPFIQAGLNAINWGKKSESGIVDNNGVGMPIFTEKKQIGAIGIGGDKTFESDEAAAFVQIAKETLSEISLRTTGPETI